MTEVDLLIEEYTKHPVNNFEMKDATISRHEGNFICWDDITVYLDIQDNCIKKMSFSWNPSNITLAASSLLAELIENQPIDEVLKRNYETMIENGFEVSPKRKRAAVIALLAVRNAIHIWREDKNEKGEIIEDDFDDLLDD